MEHVTVEAEIQAHLLDRAVSALDEIDPVLADAVRRLRRSHDAAVEHLVVQTRAQLHYREVMESRLVEQRERFDLACASMAARQAADVRAEAKR